MRIKKNAYHEIILKSVVLIIRWHCTVHQGKFRIGRVIADRKIPNQMSTPFTKTDVQQGHITIDQTSRRTVSWKFHKNTSVGHFGRVNQTLRPSVRNNVCKLCLKSPKLQFETIVYDLKYTLSDQRMATSVICKNSCGHSGATSLRKYSRGLPPGVLKRGCITHCITGIIRQ